MSVVEQTLREDPAGVYGAMDFATRDRYRHAIEKLAHGTRLTEGEVARRAIDLARAGSARDRGVAEASGDDRVAHVGFYLIGKGLPQLERSAQVRLSTPGAAQNRAPVPAAPVFGCDRADHGDPGRRSARTGVRQRRARLGARDDRHPLRASPPVSSR